MANTLKVLSHPTHASPRIVKILEDLLEEARKGELSGICMFTEYSDGRWEHTRDGMPDERVCFALDITRARVIGQYVGGR